MTIQNNTSTRNKSLLHIFQILLYNFAVELLLAAVLFLVGFGISWWFLPVCFCTSVLLCCLIDKKPVTLTEILICLFLLVLFAWISGRFYEFNYDGNAYHKVAVGLLKKHWNPLRELPSMSIAEGNIPGFESNIWAEAYCKSTWIFGAGIYAITGNIETVKCYTLIGMACAFFLVYHYMRKKDYCRWKTIFMASIAAFNPVAIQQMFSFYLDGFLHTMLIILVVSLLMLSDRKTFDVKVSASMVATSMIVCGNTKFTGLLYGGIFCIAYYLNDCYQYKKTEKQWFGKICKESLLYIGLLIVTVVWAGASPYMTNLIRHGSPTYPLTGEGKMDVTQWSSPFAEQNHFKNVIFSLFSRMDNFYYTSGKRPTLKIPFTFDQEEVDLTALVDTRISGFGVWFGGLLIVAFVIMVIWLIKSPYNRQKQLIGLNTLVCIGLTFGIQESWCARYSPYIYMLLLIAFFVLLNSKKKAVMIFTAVFSLAILFNNCLPLIHKGEVYRSSRAIDRSFQELKEAGPIEIHNGEFEGVYFNFRDKGIDYRVNNELTEGEGTHVAMYIATLWKERNE